MDSIKAVEGNRIITSSRRLEVRNPTTYVVGDRKKKGRRPLAAAFEAVKEGAEEGDFVSAKVVREGDFIVIESDKPFPVEVDGERTLVNRISVRAEPTALDTRRVNMGGGVPGTPAFPYLRGGVIDRTAQSDWALYITMSGGVGEFSAEEIEAAKEEWRRREHGDSRKSWARQADRMAQ